MRVLPFLPLAALLAACAGGQDSASTSDGTTTSSASGAGGASSSTGAGGSDGGGTPIGGGGPGCAPSGPVYGVDQLFVGDTDTVGNATADAWKAFGFDLDGKKSTDTSTDVCKPANGGMAAKAYPDGKDGIDNSFGKNIIPIFTGLQADFSDQLNAQIDNGDFGVMIRIDGLTTGNSSSLQSKVYAGAKTATPPLFDGTDCWPVLHEALVDPGDVGSAKVVFPMASVTSGTWSSGVTATMQLTLPVQDTTMTLTLHQARMTMTFDASRDHGVTGLIGGVLETEEFVTELKKVAGHINVDYCSGFIIDSLVSQIRQSSDILKDGTQDPAKTCDGISIGLGFTTSRVGLGAIAPMVQPGPDPCP